MRRHDDQLAMRSLFLLHHVHDWSDAEDTKLIGVYSSRELAESALARASRLPGFIDAPDGFQISEHELDVDEWLEGFVTMVTVEVPLRNSSATRTVEASRLPSGYQLCTDPESSAETWLFQPNDIVRCELRPWPDGTERLVAVERVS